MRQLPHDCWISSHQVTIWNRTPGKTQVLSDAGASVAATAAELASKVEAVLTILTDGTAIDAVYNGLTGLLSGNVKGRVLHRDEHRAA